MKEMICFLTMSLMAICGSQSLAFDLTNATWDEKAALLDGVDPSKPENRIAMNRYKTLVGTLAKRFQMDHGKMVAESDKTKSMLEDSGIKTSNLNILEAVHTVSSAVNIKAPFSKYAAMFLTLKQQFNLSDSEAIQTMIREKSIWWLQ